MSKFEQSKKLVASGLALTFGTFIMSGIDSTSSATTKGLVQTESQVEHLKSDQDICTQIQKSHWESNAKETFKFSKIAEVLGVSVQSVEAGEFGNAICKTGVKGGVIGAGDITKVEVKGVSDECLVIGADTDGVPKSNIVYKRLLTLCAKPTKPTAV